MKIKKLELNNFKRFKQSTINLDPELNLIVGDNGTGKSSILDALAIAASIWLLDTPDKAISKQAKRHITPDEIHTEVCGYQFGDDNTNYTLHTPSSIVATGNIGEKDNITWLRQKNSTKQKTTTSYEAMETIKNIYKKESAWLPILAYYNRERVYPTKMEYNSDKPVNTKSGRWTAFHYCLSGRTRNRFIQGWFKNETEKVAKNSKDPNFNLEAVKKAICSIPGIEDVWYDSTFSQTVFQTENDIQPYDNLGSGDKALIYLISDIAIKIVTLNPSPNAIEKTQGLVLIDELGAHLDPKKQTIMTSLLKKIFPSVQFVCTTNSPHIIGSTETEKITNLNKKENRNKDEDKKKAEHLKETTNDYFKLKEPKRHSPYDIKGSLDLQAIEYAGKTRNQNIEQLLKEKTEILSV